MTTRKTAGRKGTRKPGLDSARRVQKNQRRQGHEHVRAVPMPAEPKVGPHGCRGNEGTCAAYPVKGTALCAGHTRSEAS